ncbi:hypothetical protein HBB16_15815 [Pseudonocardia sp. MCCB 268]|nr:hypothetical protein [Pseudonocardia cytotoxica]
MILYTSGTTDRPRASSARTRSSTGGDPGLESLGIGPTTFYTCPPLFHTNALNASSRHWSAGLPSTSGRGLRRPWFWSRLASGATVTYPLCDREHRPRHRTLPGRSCAPGAGSRRAGDAGVGDGAVPRAARVRLVEGIRLHRRRTPASRPRPRSSVRAGWGGCASGCGPRSSTPDNPVPVSGRRALRCGPTSCSPATATTVNRPRPSRRGATCGSTPGTAWSARPRDGSGSSTDQGRDPRRGEKHLVVRGGAGPARHDDVEPRRRLRAALELGEGRGRRRGRAAGRQHAHPRRAGPWCEPRLAYCDPAVRGCLDELPCTTNGPEGGAAGRGARDGLWDRRQRAAAPAG